MLLNMGHLLTQGLHLVLIDYVQLNGSDNIRDFIAFPKNNAGRDIMIDSPSTIDHEQLDELKIKLS